MLASNQIKGVKIPLSVKHLSNTSNNIGE